jgi:hypothetical protein
MTRRSPATSPHCGSWTAGLADLNFGIRPIELADALYNAVTLAQDSGGLPGCPHVLISYQAGLDGRTGAVAVYGISRLIGGRTTINLETQAPDEYVSVCISRERADEVQSLLRSYGRAKSTMVGVRISEEGYDTVDFDDDGEPDVRTVHFSITKGEDTVVELAESDPAGEFNGHFDMIDSYNARGQLAGPHAFTFEAVKRVTNLKGLGATTMDLGLTHNPSVMVIAAGPHFRGILGAVDREVYAGPAGERSEHLLVSN